LESKTGDAKGISTSAREYPFCCAGGGEFIAAVRKRGEEGRK